MQEHGIESIKSESRSYTREELGYSLRIRRSRPDSAIKESVLQGWIERAARRLKLIVGKVSWQRDHSTDRIFVICNTFAPLTERDAEILAGVVDSEPSYEIANLREFTIQPVLSEGARRCT